jgi:hypothetical protein
MKQSQFDALIRQRIAEFWALRGHTVNDGRVDCRWHCEIIDLPRSHDTLHKHVDTEAKKTQLA